MTKLFLFFIFHTMKQHIESKIAVLHHEINEFTSMKLRKLISQKELDVVSNAIKDELNHLYRSHSFLL
jgi:hypothetical protein